MPCRHFILLRAAIFAYAAALCRLFHSASRCYTLYFAADDAAMLRYAGATMLACRCMLSIFIYFSLRATMERRCCYTRDGGASI